MKVNTLDYAMLRRSKFDSLLNYTIEVKHDKENSNLRLLDFNLNILANESTKTKYDGKKTVSKTVITNDLRTNTLNESKFVFDENNLPVMTDSIRIKRDKQNRLIRKETYTKSDVSGVYNIQYEFPDGKIRQISKATVNKKTGHTLIEKDMRSSDMTRTQFRYEDDPKGNRIIDYKITSADGKVLMNQSQSFEVLGENKFRSSRNNRSFLIENDSMHRELRVTDEQAETMAKIPLRNGFVVNESGDDNILKTLKSEQKIANMLKMIPGDELYNLATTTVQIKDIENKMYSYAKPKFYEDGSGYKALAELGVPDDPFVFLHELGHATDRCGKPANIWLNNSGKVFKAEYLGAIRDDRTFNKLYEEEKRNFLEEFPTSERNHINYFIAEEVVEGSPERGRAETVAETNALLNTYHTIESLGMRTQYLQQHFPKTIAYLSEKLVPTK